MPEGHILGHLLVQITQHQLTILAAYTEKQSMLLNYWTKDG